MGNELERVSGNSIAVAGSPETIEDFISNNAAQIIEKCAMEITPKQLGKVCFDLVSHDDRGVLRSCTQQSFISALIDCCSIGILPTHGRGYLVPYKNGKTGQMEVKFQIGYQGILEVAARSGITANAYLVFDGDDFEWTAGTEEKIVHKPKFGSKRTKEGFVGAYCVATLPDGSKRVEVMSREDIDLIRDRSQAGNSGPWKTDYFEMARKTVIRRASKYWPIKFELSGDEDDDADYANIPDLSGEDIRFKAFQDFSNRILEAKTEEELEKLGAEIKEKNKELTHEDNERLRNAYRSKSESFKNSKK